MFGSKVAAMTEVNQIHIMYKFEYVKTCTVEKALRSVSYEVIGDVKHYWELQNAYLNKQTMGVPDRIMVNLYKF